MKNYKLYNVECGVNDGTAFMFTQLYEVLPNGDERKINEEEWLNSEDDFPSADWVWENILDGKREDGLCNLLFPLSLEAGEPARKENAELEKLLGDLWKQGKGGVVSIAREAEMKLNPFGGWGGVLGMLASAAMEDEAFMAGVNGGVFGQDAKKAFKG